MQSMMSTSSSCGGWWEQGYGMIVLAETMVMLLLQQIVKERNQDRCLLWVHGKIYSNFKSKVIIKVCCVPKLANSRVHQQELSLQLTAEKRETLPRFVPNSSILFRTQKHMLKHIRL